MDFVRVRRFGFLLLTKSRDNQKDACGMPFVACNQTAEVVEGSTMACEKLFHNSSPTNQLLFREVEEKTSCIINPQQIERSGISGDD